MQPRLTAWYGDKDYRYSGIDMKATSWTQTLLEIKEKLEAYTKISFNSVLINFYRDGQDSMGWHRDNEKVLGDNPVIASVSFGGSRTFKIRHRTENKLIHELSLGNGDLFLMSGESQTYWQHSVPKTKSIVPPRLNLTFRQIF